MNANKLRGKIVEKGLSINKTAELIGISASSLYRKIRYCDRFTIGDAIELKRVLELTDEEAIDIFFSKG